MGEVTAGTVRAAIDRALQEVEEDEEPDWPKLFF